MRNSEAKPPSINPEDPLENAFSTLGLDDSAGIVLFTLLTGNAWLARSRRCSVNAPVARVYIMRGV